MTGSIVGLHIVFDTAAAYAFAKLRFPGRNVLFFLLLVTLMVPFQVNLIPLFRMMVVLHEVNAHLGVNTYSALVLPAMIQVFGIFLMRQFLQSIPDEVLEVGSGGRRVGVQDLSLDRPSRWRPRGWRRWRSSPSSAAWEPTPVAVDRDQ